MSVFLPSFFLEPKPGYALLPGAQPLTLLRDEHGAPLLRQLYYAPERLLYVQWFGNLTPESVVAGAEAMLVTLRQLRPLLLLNDKSIATGDWLEAMDWAEYEWLPQVRQYGLRAFAYVFSPDMHNQLAALEFIARVRHNLDTQLFYDMDIAHNWLLDKL